MNKYWQVVCLALMFSMNAAHSKNLYDGEKYWLSDSDEQGGPNYDFEDISLSGTSISLSDDDVEKVDIGFEFVFYDQIYTSVNVSSNGYISFNSTSNGCCSGQGIPGASSLKAGVAAWWEDLNPGRGGSIEFQALGDGLNQYFIIQFSDVPTFSSSGVNTFQYKFFEDTGVIEVHYKELSGRGTHTIGIQNENSTVGIEYFIGDVDGQNTGVPMELPYAIRYEPNIQLGYYLNGSSNVLNIPENGAGVFELTLVNHSSEGVEINLDYLSQGVDYEAESQVTLPANSEYVLKVQINYVAGAQKECTFPIEISVVGDEEYSYLAEVKLSFSNTVQITPAINTGAKLPSINKDATAGVFISKEDLVGTGKPTNSEDVFYYDARENSVVQLTNNGSGKDCSEAVISGDGKWIVMLCDSDLDPTNPVTGGLASLYLYDFNTQLMKRVASIADDLSPTDAGNTLAINHDGSKVIFLSEYDVVNSGENEESVNVYSYEKRTGSVNKLSDFEAGSLTLSLSMDYVGSVFTVSSSGDPLLENSDRSLEVFVGTLDHGVTKQLTHSEYDSWQSVISGNGDWISFVSDRIINTDEDDSSPKQVYRMKYNGSAIEALTGSYAYHSQSPSINFDGSKITFISEASIGVNNSSNNSEVFLKDYSQNTFLQLTEINAGYDAMQPKISQDGTVIVFWGNGDWQPGYNTSNQYQVFAVTDLEGRHVYLNTDREEESKAFGVVIIEDADVRSEDGLGSLNLFILFGSLIFAFKRKSKIPR